jgi:hypothetical protein
MAVRVIFKTQSRGFKILGSGTSSTRTSFLPNQQSAFIHFSFVEAIAECGFRIADLERLEICAQLALAAWLTQAT